MIKFFSLARIRPSLLALLPNNQKVKSLFLAGNKNLNILGPEF